MSKIKNVLGLIGLCSVMASCVTTTKTAKQAELQPETFTATVADLDVSDQRIAYTMNPVPKEIARGGMHNVKRAAIHEALLANGGGDVIVEPEFIVSMKNCFFFKKVDAITVTGRPATYKNFRSLNDSVWTDPVFRGRPKNKIKVGGGGFLGLGKKKVKPAK